MPQGRGVVPLWLLSTTLWLSASAAPKTLRRAHFDECSECASCAPGKQRAGAGPLPTSQVLLPKCDVCTGCTASLEPFEWSHVFMGHTYTFQRGATQPSVFFVRPYNGAAPRIIKLKRIKGHDAATTQLQWVWNQNTHMRLNPTVSNAAELSVAKWMAQLGRDCPVLHEVVTLPSLRRLRTAVPGLGWKVDLRWAVTTSFAPGLSLNHVRENMDHETLLTLLDRVNSTQVKMAAVFDLLVMQGDRHGENAHITQEGAIKLIDNLDKSFIYPNSLFLPQTYISERIYVGNGGIRHPVTKKMASYADGRLSRASWPRLVFDYRCHVDPSGHDRLPKPLRQCLTALANSGAESIERRYKMPATVARGFHARIDMLLRNGFKRALTATLRIKPMSLPMDRQLGAIVPVYTATPKQAKQDHMYQTYPLRRRCCKIVFTPQIECDPPLRIGKV